MIERVVEAVKADVILHVALVALLYDVLMGWVWPWV
jgi:hypothetical protein